MRDTPDEDALQRFFSPQASLYDDVGAVLTLSKVVVDSIGEEESRMRGSGDSFMVCCPFHEDRTPSMSISDSKGLFKCFGCGVAGNLFTFEMKYRNLSSGWAAVMSLAERYPEVRAVVGNRGKGHRGDAPSSISNRRVEPGERKVQRNRMSMAMRKKRVKEICQCAAEFFAEDLLEAFRADTNSAMDYLESERGLGYETIEKYGIGWADDGRWTLTNYLTQEKGFNEDDIVEAGVAMKGRNGGVWDRFRSRIIIPICDEYGNIVGFGGRLITESEQDDIPKYLNSSDSPIFRKSQILFGADRLLRNVNEYRAGVKKRKEDFLALPHSLKHRTMPKFVDPESVEDDGIILVEGYMDVIALDNASGGSVSAVASLGTAISASQLTLATKLIKDLYAGHVIVCLDNDSAGIAAMTRICDDILPKLPDNFRFKFALPPSEVKDPDEYIAKGHGSGRDFEAYVKESAQNWIFWRGLQVAEAERERFWQLHDVDTYQFPLDDMGIPEVKVSEEALDTLSTFLSKVLLTPAQFEIPLYVHTWAEILALGVKQRIKGVSRAILGKSEEKLPAMIPGPPSRNTKADLPSLETLKRYPGYYWYFSPEAPWETLKRNPRLSKVFEASGIDALAESVTLEQYLSDKRRPIMEKQLDYENSYLLPLKEARRERGDPHEMAEQVILRTLIRCSNEQRVEALDELLTIILRCADNNVGFWSREDYQCLFVFLSDLREDYTPEEIAALVEQEPWFTIEVEELFEDYKDPEMTEIFNKMLDNPVALVTTPATCIERLENHEVKTSNADDLGNLMRTYLQERKAKTPTAQETMERLEQIASSLEFDHDPYVGVKIPTEEEEKAEIMKWATSPTTIDDLPRRPEDDVDSRDEGFGVDTADNALEAQKVAS